MREWPFFVYFLIFFILWVVPTNTGIFLHGLNYAEKAELSKRSWYFERKLGVTMHFSEIKKLQFDKKKLYKYIALYFSTFQNYCFLIISKNVWLPPIFFLDSNSPCLDLPFINCAKITSVLVGTVLKHSVSILLKTHQVFVIFHY